MFLIAAFRTGFFIRGSPYGDSEIASVMNSWFQFQFSCSTLTQIHKNKQTLKHTHTHSYIHLSEKLQKFWLELLNSLDPPKTVVCQHKLSSNLNQYFGKNPQEIKIRIETIKSHMKN